MKSRLMCRSAVFISFAGNCRTALQFYQACFGGNVTFEHFRRVLPSFPSPVITGSLIAERVIIHGSDLLPDEGRIVGNCLAVFVSCANVKERNSFIRKLAPASYILHKKDISRRLIEIKDTYGIGWVLWVM